MPESAAPNDPLLDWNVFDLTNRILDESPEEPIRPDDFGRYRFLGEKPIGSGAMGDVWLAEEVAAERLVAIKLLRRTSKPDVWARREIKRLGALEHKYVARLYNSGVLDEGTPWLAMEYVDGQPLDEYCTNNECSIRERLALFHAVCEAVRYAHARGIIHGDLKPSNIRVKLGGEPKLLDFGLAEQFQNPDGVAAQSPSARGFTPAYASPEQFRGEPVGVNVDVYALGVILYQLVAGVLPYDDSQLTYAEVEKLKTSEQRPVPPSSMGHSAPAELRREEWLDLDAICRKAMETDLSSRYSSVETLIQDLNHFVSCEPLTARQPYTWHYLLGKFAKRRRRGLLVATGVVAAVAGLAGLFTWQLKAERDKAQSEAARARQIQSFMVTLVGAGDEQAAPSKDLTLEEILDRGAKEAGALGSDPETQVELFQTLGTMYLKAGKYQKAETLLRRGLEIAARMEPNPTSSRIWIQLGLLRGDLSDNSGGEKLIREGIDRLKRSRVPPDDPLWIDSQAALGRILVQSGKYDQGVSILDPVIQRLSPDSRSQVTKLEALTALAVAHQNLGHYDAAEALNRQALDLDRQKNGRFHPRVAMDLANIASSKFVRGQYQEAETLYRESINIYEMNFPPEHPDTLAVRSILGTTLSAEGKLAEAEQVLKDILPLQTRAYNTSIHPRIAFTLSALGKLAQRRGDLNTAEKEMRQSLQIELQVFGPNDFNTATIAASLATILLREKKYALAEETVRPALKVLTDKPSPGNLSVDVARLDLGEALLKQHRFAESEKLLLSAYEHFKTEPQAYAEKLNETRQDLVELYVSLKQSERAAPFRVELATAK